MCIRTPGHLLRRNIYLNVYYRYVCTFVLKLLLDDNPHFEFYFNKRTMNFVYIQ